MTTQPAHSIPFHVPYLSGEETAYLQKALDMGHLHGDGHFTQACQARITADLNAESSFLTGSCSLALDMASIIIGLQPGDEVLVPDFTFVSTAQAIAQRGAIPVFCDIREDTLNLDERRLEEAIGDRTRAIFPIHYAGVCAEMEAINEIAAKHGLKVVEDAAQAIDCSYRGKPVGSFGDMATFSFHATKNIHCGEGGVLVINNAIYSDEAAIVWEKGTDRRKFLEGSVEKYQWQKLGTSFLPSELSAAMLTSQLEHVPEVTRQRLKIWNKYHESLKPLQNRGLIQQPTVFDHISHNGHIYYLILKEPAARKRLLAFMAERGIQTVFHYTPLHESVGGKKFGKVGMELKNASDLPHRLVRLPIYPAMREEEQNRVIEAVFEFYKP